MANCNNSVTIYGYGGSAPGNCGDYGTICSSCSSRLRREREEESALYKAQHAHDCRHSNYRVTSSHTAVCEDCGHKMGG